MVRLRCHKPQQLIEIVERIPDDMPSLDEPRFAEHSCQLGTSKRVVDDQLPLARFEADRNLLTLPDLLPHGLEECHAKNSSVMLPSSLIMTRWWRRAIHVPFDDRPHYCSVPSGLTIRP